MRYRRPGGRARLALVLAAAILVIAVLLDSPGGGGLPRLPRPGLAQGQAAGDPFAYDSSLQARYVARATAGSAHVLFAKSPGGVIATAARVAAFRGMIDRATAGTGIDPNVLEALVFVESAGRPEVIAGSDPAAAAGLTQILAQTGQSLLGMHVDLARSRNLTAAIGRADSLHQAALVKRLQAQRARIDDRFDPGRELAGTVRYLELAQRQFGRADLAVVSYHMGIGNLQQVLGDYNGGRAVPYAQLYFDTGPHHHRTAYTLLSGFGDDSSLYYWRVLGALQIMQLYRSSRAVLERLDRLETATESAAEVLHPPDRTQSFADPQSLADAYVSRAILPLPSNAASLGLAYDRSMGSLAPRVGAPVALYRGLRPAALKLLVELATGVKSLAGVAAPLIMISTVTDDRYQQQLGLSYPPATTGFSFQIARQYARRSQAEAFQAMLDRLQALNLISYAVYPTTIEVTVASDAAQALAGRL